MAKYHRLVAVLAAVVLAVALSGSAAGMLVDTAAHWSAPLIAALEARGIVSGDGFGRFNPDAPLTRAEMAKLLVLATGDDQDAQLLSHYASRYSDIPAWHWARGYIETLAESAVTRGYPDGRFGPADTVTRAQMAAFLVRAANLAEQAQLYRLEPSPYKDDADIPEWARGSVNAAFTYGLMAGSVDGTFRPLDPITRAEGGVAVLRLLEYKGGAFELTGTLVRFDPHTLSGTVRDDLGRERDFTMAGDAQYYRSGIAVSPQAISPLDQVWLVLGQKGAMRFMEARNSDLIGSNLTVQAQSITLTLRDGTTRTAAVQPGALVYLNGRPASLKQLPNGSDAYIALDLSSSEVRILDAVRTSVQGSLTGIDPNRSVVFVNPSGSPSRMLTVATDARIFLDGNTAGLQDLTFGLRVRVALDDHDTVTYLQAER